MTTAERIAALAHYSASAKEVDTYEQIRRFRAFSQRCNIATEWQKQLIALECSPLEALPAQVVRESRKQLEALQAQINQALDEVNKRTPAVPSNHNAG